MFEDFHCKKGAKMWLVHMIFLPRLMGSCIFLMIASLAPLVSSLTEILAAYIKYIVCLRVAMPRDGLVPLVGREKT